MRTGRASFGDATGLKLVFADAADRAEDAPHVLAVPGALAPIYRVTLPQRVPAAGRLRIAAQQLAEKLVIAVQSIGIVALLPERVTATTWDRAIVVDPARLADWAAHAGPSCRAILPDYLTVPAAPEWVALVRRGDSVMARIGAADGFSAPVPLAAALLGVALAEAKPVRAMVGGDVPESCLAVLEAAGVPVERQDVGPLTITSAALKHDLRAAMPGSAAPSTTSPRLWGAVAAMALLAAGLWVASLWVEIRGIERHTRALRAETTEILRRGLLPIGPIVDIRTQVARRIAESAPAPDDAAGPAATRLIGRVSALLVDSGHQIDALSLTGGELSLDVLAPDFAAVDALEAAFVADGLVVRSEQARSLSDRGVEARLSIDRTAGDMR